MVITIENNQRISLPIKEMMSEITTDKNISESFDYIVKYLENKRQKSKARSQREEYCSRLKTQLTNGSFKITKTDYHDLEVFNGVKRRIVQCPTIFHRVGCNAVMSIFEKYSNTTLIKNTGASIKGRGIHWLHEILVNDLLENPNLKFFYKCDIRKYFENINQGLMKKIVREFTSDEALLKILDNFICLLPEGLSKGLRSSQNFSNLYLSEVDHTLTELTPFFYRYCDDIIILGNNKKELWACRNKLIEMLSKIGLEVKPDEAVRPTLCGIDFLGYVTYTDDTKGDRKVYSKIRKRNKKRFARRVSRVKSRKRRQKLIGSFFGLASKGNCRHLLKTLITPHEYNKLIGKRNMKEFGEFNIMPVTLNGKKSFKGQNVSLSELHHKGVVIVDYETGLIPSWDKEEYLKKKQISTSRGEDPELIPKPTEKTLISVVFEGRMRKLWTGDKEILEILKQIPPDDFPFFVGIEVDYAGRYKKMNFVPAQKFNLSIPDDDEINRIMFNNNIFIHNSK